MIESKKTDYTIEIDNVIYRLHGYNLDNDDINATTACDDCAFYKDKCQYNNNNPTLKSKITEATEKSTHHHDCASLDNLGDEYSYFYKRESSMIKIQRKKLKL